MSLLLALAGGGGGSTVQGSLSWTESNDTASLTGSALVSGAVSWTEASDTATLAGAVIASCSVSWTEANDTASLSGQIIVSGSSAWTEASDIASLTAAIIASGSISWTESSDTFSLTGTVGSSSVSGALSWTESGDVFALTGTITGSYSRLRNLPYDPFLPLSADFMITRVGQVYRDIAVYHNTVTKSVAGTWEQMPLTMPVTQNLHGLIVAWNDRLALIARRHNELANSVSGQPMAQNKMITAKDVRAFSVQFYDQYRDIAKRYNALAKAINTLNGY